MRILDFAQVVAIALLASLSPISAVAAPTCASPLPSGSGPVSVQTPMSENQRIGLSAALFLALSDSSGENNWPDRVIKQGSGCAIATFKVGDDLFTLSGGHDDGPPRWATSSSTKAFVFLALGPPAEEGLAWYSAGGSAQPVRVKRRMSYLVVVRERLRFVTQIYDGYPAAETLKADMARSLRGDLPLIASYDPDGEAVTIRQDTASNLHAILFAHLPHKGQPAVIHGADGVLFQPISGVGMRMRGSHFICPRKVGQYELRDLKIFNDDDTALDLICRYFGGDGWISVFVTRYGDGMTAQAAFEQYEAEATRENPVKSALPGLVATGGPAQPTTGRRWLDTKGIEQGLWVTKRGSYYVEVRATFPSAEADAITMAVTDLHKAVFQIEDAPDQ